MDEETVAESSMGDDSGNLLVNSEDGSGRAYGATKKSIEMVSKSDKKKQKKKRVIMVSVFILVALVVVAISVPLVIKYLNSRNESRHSQKASSAATVTKAFVCSFEDKVRPFENVTIPTAAPTTNIDRQVEFFRMEAEQPVQFLQHHSVPYCDKYEPARIPVVGIIQTDIKASGSGGDVDVTIPLSTPRGTGGHDPDISLKYSANAGNSVLGKGWGMAFLPSITRCPKTTEQNGYSQGITMTDKDAFCAGSDQLVLVRGQSPNPLNYQGEIYRTARDSKILYKAYGARNGLGPIYWTAHLPNGMKRVFGGTVDSRVMASNGAVFVWESSSESDPFGNLINIEYQQSNDGSADWHRTAVTYAEGNARVEFNYVQRSDVTEGYVSGIQVRTTKLLSSIKTYSTMPQEREEFPAQSNNEVWSGNSSSHDLIPIFTYHFSYEQSPVSGRSLLTRFQLCDGCDTVCQPPMKFTYDRGLDVLPLQTSIIKTTSKAVPSDWYYYSNCRDLIIKYYYPALTKKLTVDVNEDNRADFVVTTWNSQGFHMQSYLSNGDGSFQATTRISLIATSGNVAEFLQFSHFMTVVVDEKRASFSVFMDDFSGDGVPDVTAVWIVDSQATLRPSLAGSQVYIATVTAKGLGGGSYDAVQYSHVDQTTTFLGSFPASKCNSILQDVNLDFKLDLLIMCGDRNGWKVMASIGDGNGLFQSGTDKISHLSSLIGSDRGKQLLVQDVNGDGSPDLVGVYAGPRGIMTFVSKSQRDGLYEPLVQQILYSESVGSEGNHSIQMASLGEGSLDLVVSGIDNGGWSVWVSSSTGDGKFTPARPITISTLPFGWGTEIAHQQILDINGDTRGDLVALRTPGKQHSGFSVYVAYSLPGKIAFSAVAELGLPAGIGSATDTDVNEPFTADVTGDGRVDIGAIHFHSYDCKNAVFGNLYVVPSQGASPLDKLTRLENGFGSWTSLLYEPMTSSSVYSKTPAHGVSVVSSPHISRAVPPRYILRSIDHDDGLGGTSSVAHFYAGYATQTRGHGSLGFAQITSTHSVTGMSQTTDFSQDFLQRRKRLPLRLRTFSRSGVLLADQNNTWSVVDTQPQPETTDAILAYTIVQQSQISNSETGQLVRSEVSEAAFDAFGNPINTNYTATDAYGIYKTITTTKYRNDELRWLIGLPEEVTQETKVAWNNAPIELFFDLREGQIKTDPSGRQWIVNLNKAKRTFDREKGTITSETLFADTSYEVVTKSTRDSRGNVIRVESLAHGESKPQTVNMEYETSGRFQVKHCDVIGFCQYWAHGTAGQVLREATDSGDVIVHRYDTLMRESQVISSQGQGVNTSLIYCDGQPASQYNGKTLVDTISCAGFSNAVYVKVIQPITGPPSYQYFDRQGRRVGASKHLKDEDVTITESTSYDKFGKAATTSLPHTAAESVITLNYGKDEFGRVVSVTNSLFPSRTMNIQHSGSNITFIDPLGRKQKHVTNAEDLVVLVAGEMQEQLRYWYDPDGNLLGVQGNINDDNAGWLIRVSYDEGGHKRALSHPDKGLYHYGHDSRGRLIWQADSNGNKVTFEWDERGRTVATHSVDGSHYYEYSKRFPDNLVAEYSTNSSFNYRLDYTYNSRGLLSQVDKTFQLLEMDPPTGSNNGCWYNSTLKYDYDATDRLTRIVYPTGFFIILMYDDDSRVTKIVDSMGRVQWQALEFNSNGQVTKEQRGNGLVTEYGYDLLSHSLLSVRTHGNGVTVQDTKYTLDDAENVIGRVDNTRGLQEIFQYDKLNRITRATVQGSGTPFSQVFRYDENSNLIYKSDVGEFVYSSDHPHAVKQVRHVNSTSNLTYEFEYDTNGNRLSGNGTHISYNSMNKPVNITRGPFTTMFDYTLTGQLMVRRDMVWLYLPQEDNSSNVTLHTYRTTVYVDDLYHEETTRDPVLKPSTVQKHYVQTYAVVVRVINGTVKVVNDSHGNVTDIQGGYDQLYVTYPYTDIKGSLSLVTDETGRALQEYSFDVCGSPRSPRTWRPLRVRDELAQASEFLSLDEAENLLSPYQHTDQQGYDGHEQLRDIGGDLVHMGGRLYDSVHCTFATPDPTNDDSYSLVGYNSYAYGRFNSLSGSDPSGYGFFSWIGHVFSSIFHFFEHIVEGIVHFIVHIVDDIVSVLRKFPILDELVTVAIDIFADVTGNVWIEFAWNIINDRIRGESWGDILKDGLINLATSALGSVAKDATGVEKYLVDAANGGLQALSHGGNVFKGTLMGVVGDVANDVAGLIVKGPSNYFTFSYHNVPYLKFDLSELAKKAIEGAIDSAARDAINGDFGDILKDTLHGAWNGFKNDFVKQWDKQKKEFQHKVLTKLKKWITKKVPLIGKVEKDLEKVKKFFGGAKKPKHDAQTTTDARSDVDRTIPSFAKHFTVKFNLHTHAIYFQAMASADFFYSHRTQLMYLQVKVHAEASETWKWQL